MSLTVEIEESEGGRHKVILCGKLDTSTAPTLDERVQPLLKTNPKLVVFEMGGLDYVSSAGLRIIFKTKKQVGGGGGNTFLVNLQPQVRKVFELVKTVDLTMFANLDELDEYLDHLQTKDR